MVASARSEEIIVVLVKKLENCYEIILPISGSPSMGIDFDKVGENIGCLFVDHRPTPNGGGIWTLVMHDFPNGRFIARNTHGHVYDQIRKEGETGENCIYWLRIRDQPSQNA